MTRRRACFWLSDGVIDDPKLGALSDRLWRRCIELFALSNQSFEQSVGRYGEDDAWQWCGRLPSLASCAWKLHLVESVMLEDLQALAEVDVVREIDGVWWVVNFRRWQAPQTAAERKRAQRKREAMSRNVTDTVTQPHDRSIMIDRSDREIDRGSEGLLSDLQDLGGLFESEARQVLKTYGVHEGYCWLAWAVSHATTSVDNYLRKVCIRNGDDVPIMLNEREITTQLAPFRKDGKSQQAQDDTQDESQADESINRWKVVRTELEGSMDRVTFSEWIARLDFVSWSENVLVLVARDTYVQDWVKNRLMPAVQRVVDSVAGCATEIRIEVV